MNLYTDTELINSITEGGEIKSKAFTELYNRYSSRVYLYCRKIIGDGRFADDIFQETFLKFLDAIEKGNHINNVLGYLLRTSKNLIYNYKRDNPYIFVEIEDFHVSINDNSYESLELSKLIEHGLNLIPEEHKEAFVLQAFEGLSYNEIGELTGVPITTVRNRVVRAKRRLREILMPYLDYSRNKEYE
jgi:RNA polymerase sigma-70 factor, ECF subfamily